MSCSSVAIAVFALFAYKNPEAAAELVQQAGAILMQIADQLGKFAAAF